MRHRSNDDGVGLVWRKRARQGSVREKSSSWQMYVLETGFESARQESLVTLSYSGLDGYASRGCMGRVRHIS